MWCDGFGNVSWIFWVLLLLIIFWWKPDWKPRDWERRRGNGAEDILSEKFAKGELTKKEYEEKIEVLKKHAR